MSLMMISNEDNIWDLYSESTEARMSRKSFTGSLNIISILSNLSSKIMPLLFFTYFVKPHKNKIILYILAVSLLHGPLSGIAHASRLQLISQLIIIFFLYFFFRPYIPKPDLRILKRGGVALFSLVLLVFMTITIARAERSDSGETLYNIERYFAQGPLNFNLHCMDANGTREGHVVIPLLVHLAGGESLTEEQLRFKYSHMTIDNRLFSTYVGDFVLDFGPTISFFLFALFSIIFCRVTTGKSGLNYGQVVSVYIVLRFCGGFYQYGFGSVDGNLALLVLIIFSVFFSLNRSFIPKGEVIIKK